MERHDAVTSRTVEARSSKRNDVRSINETVFGSFAVRLSADQVTCRAWAGERIAPAAAGERLGAELRSTA
jgi:hypothetical protein